MFTSSVCRASLPESFQAMLPGPGKHEIPASVLPAREVVIECGVPFTAKFVNHNGRIALTTSPMVASDLVRESYGKYEEQFASVQSMEAYLKDDDILSPRFAEEKARAEKAQTEGESLVLVSVIGGERGMATVLRNIVSGCLPLDTPEQRTEAKRQAQAALDKITSVLIE